MKPVSWNFEIHQFDLITDEFENRFVYRMCECGHGVGHENAIIAGQAFLNATSISINVVCAHTESYVLFIFIYIYKVIAVRAHTHKCR